MSLRRRFLAVLLCLLPALGVVFPELALAQELARESLSAETRRGYRSGWQHFASWCQARGVSALPAEPGIVAT